MCRKLLFLIAVLGLVSTAWAIDLNPPPWRGEPGSGMWHWTYDADSPYPEFPRADAPEVETIVPHPHKADPVSMLDRAIGDGWIQTWWEPGGWVDDSGLYAATSAMQLWAGGSDIWVEPTGWEGQPPTWMPTFFGHTGVMTDFAMGSWDLYNFSSDPPQPEKLMWIQLTWMPMDPTEPVTWSYELEAFTTAPLINTWWSEAAGWVENNRWDEGEGPYGEFPPSGEIWETWWEGAYWEAGSWQSGGWIAWGSAWLEETFWQTAGWNSEAIYDAFYGGDLVAFEDIDLGDGWTLSKFLLVADEFNPDEEFFGLFPSLPIALDEIVIDTICIPEPITIALLGFGGLVLIRRRKR